MCLKAKGTEELKVGNEENGAKTNLVDRSVSMATITHVLLLK